MADNFRYNLSWLTWIGRHVHETLQPRLYGTSFAAPLDM